MRWRGGDAFLKRVADDASLLDALSFPVTILFGMAQLNLVPGSHLNVLALGTSRRAEERVARSSRIWDELSHYFDTKIDLWLVGPEISGSGVVNKTAMMTTRVFKGTYLDFAKAHTDVVENQSTFHVIFNGGFGNFPESGQYSLLWSWLPDLRSLTASNAPLMFTTASK